MFFRLVLTFLLLISFLANTQAQECSAIFTDGLQNHKSGGSIDFRSNSQLLNSPLNFLDTEEIKQNWADSCGTGVQCIESGGLAAEQDFNINNNGSHQEFDNEVATLTPGDYRKVTLRNGSELTLTPGEYHFSGDFVLTGASKILLDLSSDPNGTVRIYTDSFVSFSEQSKVNEFGNSESLLIYNTENFTISDSTVSAFVYSQKRALIQGNGLLIGAINANEIVLNDATVDYPLITPFFDGFCDPPPGPAPDCEVLFPGSGGNEAPSTSPIAMVGDIASVSIANSAICNGNNDCDKSDFAIVSQGRIPVVPSGGTDLGDFEEDNLISRDYNFFSDWGNSHNVSTYTDSDGTALIYIQSNNAIDIPNNTSINWGNNGDGKTENILLVIESDSSVQIGNNFEINGFVYIASPSIDINNHTIINGALTVDTDDLTIGDIEVTYNTDDLVELTPHGFCNLDTPQENTCEVNTTNPIIFSDDFVTTNNWYAQNFTRTSNWPGDNRFFDTSDEEQNILFSINGQLNIAGNAASADPAVGQNEFGMVGYDFSSDIVDSRGAINYSIDTTIDFGVDRLNNDTGIVFGYQNEENYYLARWVKYGTVYSTDSNFPGEYRRLELVKVLGGVASHLDYVDNVELENNATVTINANSDGIKVCTGDVTGNNQTLQLQSSEIAPLRNIGIFSYDNDDGIALQNIEVRCGDCESESLVAMYRFEHENLDEITDTSGNNLHGIDLGGVSIEEGKYCRGFDSEAQNTNETTDKAFQSGVNLIDDVGLKGTVSFWFNSHTDWNIGGNNGGKRTLFDASLYQDSDWNSNNYFHLGLNEQGALRLAFKDSNYVRYIIEEPPGTVRDADTWHYVTATWDFTTDTFELYLDASLLISETQLATSGALSVLGPIVFGDNSSTYSSNSADPNPLPSRFSANGRFDEVRIYNLVRTQAEILEDMLDQRCNAAIHHFEILHDGHGITCAEEPIILRACANSNCRQLYNDPFTVDLFVNGDYSKTVNGIFGGAATSFNFPSPGVATLSLGQTYECKDGVSSSCDVIFETAGFIFSPIYDKVAGVDFPNAEYPDPIELRAVDGANGSCEDILVDDGNVELAVEYESPNKSTNQIYTILSGTETLPKNLNGAINNFNEVELDFGINSTADLGINNYGDAGQIKLHAKKVIPDPEGGADITIRGESLAFWVEPYNFYLQATQGGTLLNNTTSGGATTQAAGEAFSIEVSARNAFNVETTNYESKQPQLRLVRTGPTDTGVEGTLTFSDTHNNNAQNTIISGLTSTYQNKNGISFSNGRYVFDQSTYTEVGLIQLWYRDPSYGILAKSTHPEGYTDIGRFIPSYFIQTVDLHGELHGVHDSTVTGDADCRSDDWVYSGEKDLATLSQTPALGAIQYVLAPRYRITAYNGILDSDGNGQVTQNYTSDYMKLTAGSVVVILPTNDLDQVGAESNLVELSATLSQGTISEESGGIMLYGFDADDHYTYLHNINSEIAPFQAQIPLAISSIIDTDGVAVDMNNDEHSEQAIAEGIAVRFGRLVVENTYGPETSNLPQHLFVEAINSSSKFELNNLDKCTIYDSINVTLTDEGLPASLTSINTASGLLTDGRTRDLILAAPGSGNTGGVGVTYDIFDWLKYHWGSADDTFINPKGIATFGLYRGNDRIIYRREVNN